MSDGEYNYNINTGDCLYVKPVLLNWHLLFIHLKQELLTQFTVLNDEKYVYIYILKYTCEGNLFLRRICKSAVIIVIADHKIWIVYQILGSIPTNS